MTAPARLLRRAEFLAVAASGRKWVMPGVILQWAPAPDPSQIRYGLTASRKVGGAVQRNRARRRLRALTLALLPNSGLNGCDLVLIARPATVTRTFADLRADLLTALAKAGATT